MHYKYFVASNLIDYFKEYSYILFEKIMFLIDDLFYPFIKRMNELGMSEHFIKYAESIFTYCSTKFLDDVSKIY